LWKKSEGSKATHTYSNKMKKEKKMYSMRKENTRKEMEAKSEASRASNTNK
jgi:hypothetical protein